jgi:hypothetical protein
MLAKAISQKLGTQAAIIDAACYSASRTILFPHQPNNVTLAAISLAKEEIIDPTAEAKVSLLFDLYRAFGGYLNPRYLSIDSYFSAYMPDFENFCSLFGVELGRSVNLYAGFYAVECSYLRGEVSLFIDENQEERLKRRANKILHTLDQVW